MKTLGSYVWKETKKSTNTVYALEAIISSTKSARWLFRFYLGNLSNKEFITLKAPLNSSH